MKRHVLKQVVILILLFLSPALASQTKQDANNLHTMSDYLLYASLNNAELKSQFENWKAALEQIPQAKALDDPKFTYSYFLREVETRVGPQRQKLGIMQVFPWFGTIEARTDVASANARAAYQKYQMSKLTLYQQVKDAFYEYTYLETAIDTARENLELLKHFEEIARTKYRTATATHPDIIRAQLGLATLEDVLTSLEQFREPTVAKLNSNLNRPSNAPLPQPVKEPHAETELNRQQIIETLVHNNPELAELDWQYEAAKAEVELAKKKFYPNIGVGVDWIQTDGALAPGVRDSGKDPVVLMFSMNIPLWRDSYSAAESQAKANVRKVRQKKIEAENVKIAKAIELIYNIEDNQRKINLYGDVLVPKAEQLVEVSEAAYMSGSIDFLGLIDAQQMLLKYTLDYERAKTNHQQKIAELEKLTGTEY